MKCPSCGQSAPPERLQCDACGEVLLEGAADSIAPPANQDTAPTTPVKDSPTLVTEEETPPTVGLFDSAVTPPGVEPTRVYDTPGVPTGQSAPPGTGGITLPPDSQLGGRYQILGVLGQGGMGVVYKAKDLELERIIALKTIRADQDEASDVVRRFKQELLLARKITHKNVIRIHDMGEGSGVRFFTMEWIDGPSLKRLLKQRGKLPPDEAVAIARQVLGALEEAHSQGVVHRDLKPQNIMVDAVGIPYVMDFGIARSTENTQMTATGAVVGTPDYMAPEQVRGSKVGPQADLFAFGVMFYEMLTGELPYKGDSAVSKLMARLSHDPRRPREIDAEIPPYLESVVLKCMERDTALRYQSAAEVLHDLDRTQVDRSLTLRALRAVDQHRGSAIAAGIAAAATAVAGYLFLADRTPVLEQPEAVTTVAVLPLTNAAGSEALEWLRDGIPDMLFTDIGQSRWLRPIPAERVERVLHQLGVTDQTRFDETTLDAIGERVPADHILYGQFVEVGDQLRFDLVLRAAGVGIPLPIKVAASRADVLSVVDQLTTQLREQLIPAGRADETDRPVADVSTGSLEARRAYQAGLEELRQGANQSAVELLGQAVDTDPKFAMAYAKLAEAYMETGKHREAAAAADRAVTLSEESALPMPERYQVHAIAATVADDFERAAQSLNELAELYPGDPDVRFSLARTRERLGHLPEALAAYQQVIAREPEHPAALLGLGRVQVMSGAARDAVESLTAALATGSFEEDLEALGMIHSILGVAQRELGELDKSVEHLDLSLDFRKRVGDARGQATTLMNLASIYEYRGELRRATEFQTRALQIHRELGDHAGESTVLVEMGLTYKAGGKLDEALEAFRATWQIESESEDHAAMANRLDHIADIYRLKGRYDDAMVYLGQARTHLEQSHEPREQALNLNYTGIVKRAQGQYKEALEAFLAARPLFQEIHHDMGLAANEVAIAEIYRRQGRYGDAYASLERSRELYEHLEHDIAEVHVPMGFLLIALGQPDQAEQRFQAAAHGHGAHHDAMGPEVLLGTAEIASFRGQLDVAAEAYEKANFDANLSGRKEVAVKSRVELGRLLLGQGKLDNALRLLRRTREEASQARLRPLEAEAALALADVHLARSDAAAAREQSLDAIAIAERFDGRPVLYRAYAALGDALEELDRGQEAADAYAKATAALDFVRGSLRPEHAASFAVRADIRAFVERAAARLEDQGLTDDAAELRGWLTPAATGG